MKQGNVTGSYSEGGGGDCFRVMVREDFSKNVKWEWAVALWMETAAWRWTLIAPEAEE